MHGKVAVTLVEWAGVNDQRIVVPWRLIDGPESARAVAAEMAAAPVRRAFRTSISGALLFSAAAVRGQRLSPASAASSTCPATAPTIRGRWSRSTRDEVVAKGIVINGLPIMLKEPQPGSIDIKDLDIYYEDCVIGGPGAFVVPIREREKFKDAIRTKLVLDIADRSASRASSRRRRARRASPAPSASRCGSAAGAAAGSICGEHVIPEQAGSRIFANHGSLHDRNDFSARTAPRSPHAPNGGTGRPA